MSGLRLRAGLSWIYRGRLYELPPEIGRLTKLEVLKLGRREEKRGNLTVYWQNHLKDLPTEVKQLVNLTELDLSNLTIEKLGDR